MVPSSETIVIMDTPPKEITENERMYNGMKKGSSSKMAGRIHYLRYLFTLKKMSLDQLLTIRRQRRLRHERRMVCKKTLVKQMPRADTTTRLPMSSRTSFFFFTNFYLVKTRGPNFAALAPYVTPRQESGSKLLIQLWTRK